MKCGRALPTACVLLVLASAAADGCDASERVLSGHVVWVADGDSFALVDAAGNGAQVRLAGIDAPEKGQAFANASRSNMIRLIRDQDVRVEWYKLDRYDRYVGKVWVRSPDAACTAQPCPATLDVAIAQLVAGLAWYFKRFESELDAADRIRYADAERAARMQRTGLWRDVDPLPPWEWRARQRSLRQ